VLCGLHRASLGERDLVRREVILAPVDGGRFRTSECSPVFDALRLHPPVVAGKDLEHLRLTGRG
jgi:hypothetical protein